MMTKNLEIKTKLIKKIKITNKNLNKKMRNLKKIKIANKILNKKMRTLKTIKIIKQLLKQTKMKTIMQRNLQNKKINLQLL